MTILDHKSTKNFYPRRGIWFFISALCGLALYFINLDDPCLQEMAYCVTTICLIGMLVRFMLNSQALLQIKTSGIETRRLSFSWQAIQKIIINHNSDLIIQVENEEIPLIRLSILSTKDRRALLQALEQNHAIEFRRTTYNSVIHDFSWLAIPLCWVLNFITWSSYIAQQTGYLFNFFQN